MILQIIWSLKKVKMEEEIGEGKMTKLSMQNLNRMNV